MPKKSKIVITGATGFVGANLCRHFLSLGHEVVALTGTTRTDWRLPVSAPGLKKTHLNLMTEGAVREFILREQPRVWLNCAAYGAYPSQTDSGHIYRICFDAVRWMLEALREVQGFEAFVQMGSQSEYGFNCTAPSEDSATVPDSDYAVAKVAATAITQLYGKKYGVPAWALRLYSVYGPFEESSRLVIKLLDHARQGKMPPLVSPKTSRDFIHVSDVCAAVEALLSRSSKLARGEVYNIGSGQCTTLEKLVATTNQAFSLSLEPAWGSMTNRHWDHSEWYSNPSKAQRDLGWQAKLGLREGLVQTMNWIKSNPDAMAVAAQQSVIP